jgi:hypothetical protein
MEQISKSDWKKVNDANPDVFATKFYRYLELKSSHPRKFFLALDSSNQYCIMFKTTRALLEGKDFPDTDGLEVRLDVRDPTQVGVVLKLKSDDFLEIFTTLANDLIGTLRSITDDKQFIDTFFGRLGIWKMFLDQSGPNGLGAERRRGLFGELYLLKELIISSRGTDSIKYWTGPTGAMHDFELGKIALECKTMAGNRSQKISISNERQLEDDGYESLFLACVAITVRKNAEPSLVTLVKDIEGLLGRDPLNLVNFHNSLLSSGYNKIHEELYAKEGYHVDDVLYYRVSEGFPRLLAKNLPNGVGGLGYTVDLSACLEFKTMASDVEESIKRK